MFSLKWSEKMNNLRMVRKRLNITSIRMSLLLLALCIIFAAFGCSEVENREKIQKPPTAKKFNEYWFQGLAEISRFELEQVCYNEIHKGDAVLIFVTEEFFSDRQVKSEHGRQPGAVSVLKLNFLKKFKTGIYPYSLMSSIFTPIERKAFPRTLKVTTSIQEWCGQSFTQLNLKEGKYHILLRSYFMNESDQQYAVEATQLEDDIWTSIRINPFELRTGEIQLIPGSQFSRLKRINQEVRKAVATLGADDDLYTYTINYKDIPRNLIIRFKKTFPYEILEWEEAFVPEKGTDQSVLTTRAVRTHVMLVDYWNKNTVKDLVYRKKLGLK
jgi:hypothetical protein